MQGAQADTVLVPEGRIGADAVFTGRVRKRSWQLYCGDARGVLDAMEAESADCVVTSPPYFWQRDYGVDGQLGKEPSIEGYVQSLSSVMMSVHRVLKRSGTLFLNLGDTYYSGKGMPHGNDRKHPSRRLGLRAVDASGLGPSKKTTLGMPWRVALQMISQGWILRAPIIWQRPTVLPEPRVLDRPWRSYETVYLFTKSTRYYFNSSHPHARSDVWRIHSQSGNARHPAAFPRSLADRCVGLGCAKGGTVLDPFVGSGTTMMAALRYGCDAIGVDLNPSYIHEARDRLRAL